MTLGADMIETTNQNSATSVLSPEAEGADDAAQLRERAEALLQSLKLAQQRCDLHLQRSNRTDALREVTGRSSFDHAIASAKRAIDVLDKAATTNPRK